MKNNSKTLFEKIDEGVKFAYEKLVRETALVDGELIFCENGKIIKTKAKKLLLNLK